MYATTNLVNVVEATAALSAHATAFPLISKALRRACTGAATEPAQLGDFDVLVLSPALLAVRAQQHGLEMLRKGVRDSAALAGGAGSSALRAFEEFDYYASEAIVGGEVEVEVSPLDLALGVLPLMQLALHLWFDRHSFRASAESPLVALARGLNFASATGALQPERSLQEAFLPAWAQATSAVDEIPVAAVYHAIVQVLHRDMDLIGAPSTFITIGGVATSWSTFARDRGHAWRTEYSGAYDGTARKDPSLEDLQSLIRCLIKYGRVCAVTSDPETQFRPPSSGSGSSRVTVARLVAGAAGSPPDGGAAAAPPVAAVKKMVRKV
jgi:hypothetical protein